MRLLITGGAGFIGSNACEFFKHLNWSVTAIDNLGTSSNVNHIYEIATYVNSPNGFLSFDVVELRNQPEVDFFIDNHTFDYVLHLAAESHVDRSLQDSSPFWDTQVRGTYNLFNALSNLPSSRQPKCIINQITDEVYGEVEPGQHGAVEGQVFNPRPPYACSKAAQYFVGKSFSTTGKLPIISTFPVNNFGPRQAPEKIIPKFITMLLNNQKVPLMASTHFERDWLTVSDMCRAFHILFLFGTIEEDYNVGADNHRTNLQLTKEILALLDKDESYIEIVPDRTTHDSRYAVNSNKLRQLGWAPRENFTDWLEYTISWYKERQNNGI